MKSPLTNVLLTLDAVAVPVVLVVAGEGRICQTQETIERVFAGAEEKRGMRYTLCRGLVQVSKWVRLKFAAMKLKKLARWSAKRRSRLSFLLFSAGKESWKEIWPMWANVVEKGEKYLYNNRYSRPAC